MFTLRCGIWWETDLLEVSRVIIEGGKGIFGKEIQQDTENAKLGTFNLILVFRHKKDEQQREYKEEWPLWELI